jgi:hypothetical protein
MFANKIRLKSPCDSRIGFAAGFEALVFHRHTRASKYQGHALGPALDYLNLQTNQGSPGKVIGQ